MKQPKIGCFIIYQLLFVLLLLLLLLFILLSAKKHIIPTGYFLLKLIAFATDI
jgi:hypothetical protein